MLTEILFFRLACYMVIDSSALVAVLTNEPEARVMARAIASDSKRLMGAVSVLETGIVIEARYGPAGGRELDLLLHRCHIDIVPLSSEQVELAREAYRQFGKGNHPAGLNLGDCATYALSRSTGEPVLFKGQDFSQTDLRLVPYQE